MNLPRVPLEAGASPDNPPCPVCSEPLFPWVGMPVASGIAQRCEACGLAVLVHGEKFHFPKRPGERDEPQDAAAAPGPGGAPVGRTSPGVPPGAPAGPGSPVVGGYLFDPGTADDVASELALLREGDSYYFDNRASLSCWLTGGAWVGLASDRRYCFTPDAVSESVAKRDHVVTGTKWRIKRGIAVMWQSGINMFTFGQNVVLGSLGKAHALEADHAWKRGLDWFISVVLAIPAAVIAVPLELLGILFRRGSSAKSTVN